MDLFNHSLYQNLLPFDGHVCHHGFAFNKATSQAYFNKLIKTIPWKRDELIIYGKHIITARKIAWFGNSDYEYSYGNTLKKALPWTEDLLEIKRTIESKSGVLFNSCLLNLYHSGNEGMSWHQDNEKELGENPVIASLSLGASRKFSFKHKTTNRRIDLILESGSLILMKGQTQANWRHSLPKNKKVSHARINLTFRSIYV